MLFKGDTSLSKAFGLIKRSSADIDITVFRYDLGQEAEVAGLDALSRKNAGLASKPSAMRARPISRGR